MKNHFRIFGPLFAVTILFSATAQLPTNNLTPATVALIVGTNGVLMAPTNFFAANSNLLNAANLTGTVANSQLANSSVTVSPGAGLIGGGAVALGSSITLNTTATSANTPGAIVSRDSSGNFSAGTITGTVVGTGTNMTGIMFKGPENNANQTFTQFPNFLNGFGQIGDPWKMTQEGTQVAVYLNGAPSFQTQSWASDNDGIWQRIINLNSWEGQGMFWELIGTGSLTFTNAVGKVMTGTQIATNADGLAVVNFDENAANGPALNGFNSESNSITPYTQAGAGTYTIVTDPYIPFSVMMLDGNAWYNLFWVDNGWPNASGETHPHVGSPLVQQNYQYAPYQVLSGTRNPNFTFAWEAYPDTGHFLIHSNLGVNGTGVFANNYFLGTNILNTNSCTQLTTPLGLNGAANDQNTTIKATNFYAMGNSSSATPSGYLFPNGAGFMVKASGDEQICIGNGTSPLLTFQQWNARFENNTATITWGPGGAYRSGIAAPSSSTVQILNNALTGSGDLLVRTASVNAITITNSPITFGTTKINFGAGSPNSAVTGSPGDIYYNTSGGSATTLYVKESGSATTTGWVGK